MHIIGKEAIFCPVCDWAITKTQKKQIKVDIECPGCGCKNISEFGAKVSREEPDPADWWKRCT